MNNVEYLYQNSSGANEWMKKVGCFWRVGMHIAELITGKAFETIEELNMLWKDCIDKELMINSPTGPIMYKGVCPITNRGLQYFDSDKTLVEIGTSKDGEEHLYGWARGREEKNRFYIMKGILDEKHQEPFHYKLVEKDLTEIFDPYLSGLETIGEEYTIITEVI